MDANKGKYAHKSMTNHLYRFWAKTTHDAQRLPRAYHPLLCHMIDVGSVARELWRNVLPRAARRSIARSVGLSEGDAEACTVWLVGLHDLGKASPPFTLREGVEQLHPLYEHTPFSLSSNRRVAAKDAPHGIVTAQALPEILCELGFPRDPAKQISSAIGGHHGVIPRSEEINSLKRSTDKIGNAHWKNARQELAHELARLLEVETNSLASLNVALDNAALMWLAGLTSVADWIGSNQSYFPCRVEDAENFPNIDFSDYLADAGVAARTALQQLGWANWATPDTPRSFEQLFPGKSPPRGVQIAAIALAPTLNTPGIVIVEAPMGEGKTEAAMYLADHWSITLEARGCYFALPTQATSNQMFLRVRDFLAKRSDTDTATLQLLHGHAALSAEFEILLDEGRRTFNADCIAEIRNDGALNSRSRQQSPAQASVVAAEWFTYRKRGLLAPFGVGTIDQSLLAVLQTPHVFVRLFALAHKIVIIDEVHAYDAYMSALLERLLEWLAALQSPVILLSATLPRTRSQALIRAYTRGLAGATPELETSLTVAETSAPYPRLSWATNVAAGAIHLSTSAQSTRTLHLEWVNDFTFPREDTTGPLPATTPLDLAKRLHDALSDSEGNLRGCVAIICNTVRRAQEVYEALRPCFPGAAFQNDPDDTAPLLDLLHARYLFRDRAAREHRTLERFGKPDAQASDDEPLPQTIHRPACAVLVSTQIIEQSLDIDFDLMITDLAPVDLLLQRAGRLHRHARSKHARPVNLRQPTLWIIKPAMNDDSTPDFGASGYVYAPHILLRSWLELRERKTIEIPAEVEELIEAVYDDGINCPSNESSQLQKFWSDTTDELRQKRELQESKARSCRLPSPTYDTDELLEKFNRELEEDNPQVHASLQALTRDDSLPSVSVVCLNPHEMHKIKRNEKPDIREVKFLLERSVSIAKQGAVQAILAFNGAPKGWRESPHLRHHRLIELDEHGCQRIGNFKVRLDGELGIVIGKLNEGNS